MSRRGFGPRSAVCLLALAVGACSAPPEPAPPTGTVPATFAPAPETSPSESRSGPTDEPDGPGPLNEFESRVVLALTEIGVDEPHPVEHVFRSAMVGGEMDGRFIVVHSYEHGSPQEPAYGTVTSEVMLNGTVPASVVTTPAFGDVVRFVCSGMGYQVASLDMDLAPGSSQVDDARRVASLMAGPAAGLSC